jgi:hypothetical protein
MPSKRLGFKFTGGTCFNENINIESLSNGNYIIKIQTDSKEVAFKKLIKI